MEESWRNALALMREALQILDESGAPADVGAHIDLAIHRLDENMAAAAVKEEHVASPETGLGQTDAKGSTAQ